MGTATWGTLIFAAAIALLVIGIPGSLIGVGLRLRGLWLAGTAPVFGVTAVVTAAVLAAWTRVSWALWVVVVVAAVIAGLCRIVRFVSLRSLNDRGALLRTSTRTDRGTAEGWRWAAPIAVGIAALLLLGRVIFAIGAPDWFDQAGDNVFHLNAVRVILDHGNASPSGLASIGGGTYPDAWHAIVALVVQLTGVSIPVASNAVFVVVACGVWPLGIVLLTRVLFGPRTPVIFASGLASAGFAAYPLLLLPYMGTYPLMFSIALIAPALAGCIALLGVGRDRVGMITAVIVVVLSVPGLVVAHPSAALMLLVMVVPVTAVAAWRFGRIHPSRSRLGWLAFALYAVATFATLIAVRPSGTQPDSLRGTAAQAWGEVLLGAYASQRIPIVMSAFTIVGIVVALRRDGGSGWVAVGVWAAVGGMYVTAVVNDEFIHLVFSQPWFGDATRIAAFTPISIAPLAARGTGAVWDWSVSRMPQLSLAEHRGRRVTLSGAAVAILAVLVVGSSASRGSTVWARSMFTPTDNVLTSPIPVSTDDRAIFRWITTRVPAHDLLAGDPWNGNGFAYALTGRPVLVSQMLQPINGQTKTFLDEFSSSTSTGAGCRAARTLGVKWVLDLHPDRLAPSRPQYPGVRNLASSPNVELAYRVGDSAIYRVVGCGVQ